MTEKEFLDKIHNFLSRQLSAYGEPTMPDNKRTPYDDLAQVHSMIEEYKKMSVIEDGSRVHPNAVIKLSGKKISSEERAKQVNLEIELVQWSICPKCGGDMDVVYRKWWQRSKPWCVKTCQKCGNVKNVRPPVLSIYH